MVCVIGVVSFNTNNQLNPFEEKLLWALWTAYWIVYWTTHYRHPSITATHLDEARPLLPSENILRQKAYETIDFMLRKNNKADFLGCDDSRIRLNSEWKKRLLSYTAQLMCATKELWPICILQENTAWREIDPNQEYNLALFRDVSTDQWTGYTIQDGIVTGDDPNGDGLQVIDIRNVLTKIESLEPNSWSYQISF